MGDETFPDAGQRWRSLIDGHMVVTGRRAGDALWIRYDGTYLAIAMDAAVFLDGYEFVDILKPITPTAIAS